MTPTIIKEIKNYFHKRHDIKYERANNAGENSIRTLTVSTYLMMLLFSSSPFFVALAVSIGNKPADQNSG